MCKSHEVGYSDLKMEDGSGGGGVWWISLSSTSCNGGAESDVLLDSAAGAESTLGYLLLISIANYSFKKTPNTIGTYFGFFQHYVCHHERIIFSASETEVGEWLCPLVWKREL